MVLRAAQNFSARWGRPNSDSFQYLPASKLKSLQELLRKEQDPKFLELSVELDHLSQERNPELFWASLLILGDRCVDRGRLDLAASIYSEVSASATAEEKIRATQRLHAVLGKGSFGRRVEFLATQAVQEATSARAILPMVGGSLVGRMAGATVLGRLGNGMRNAWWTRGVGVRALAGTCAYLAEIPIFTGISRALAVQPEGSVSDELKRSALTLGAIKIFSSMGNYLGTSALSRVPASLSPLKNTAAEFVSQGSVFFGLLSAHKLEEHFQLRSPVDNATWFADTLGAMVSLGVGANLGMKMLGQGFANFQRELEIRAASRVPPASSTGLQSIRETVPSFARATRLPSALRTFSAPRWTQLEMRASEGGAARSGAKNFQAYLNTCRRSDAQREARAATQVELPRLLATLTSGRAEDFQAEMLEAIQRGGDSLKELSEANPGNAAYWENILEEFYVKTQFSTWSRSVVEPVTNSIDATLKKKRRSPVQIFAREGEITILDQGIGIGPEEIFSLLIPTLSEKGWQATEEWTPTGKFGVGFYSILNFLNRPQDRIVVQSLRKGKGYHLIFSRPNGALQLSINALRSRSREDRTRVTIRSLDLNETEVAQTLRDYLAFNTYLPLHYNGKRLNPALNLSKIAFEDHTLKYDLDQPSKAGQAYVTVNGVTIFKIPLMGPNIPRLLVLEMPPDTPIPVSRNDLSILGPTIHALKGLTHAIPPGSSATTLMNGLWSLIKFFQAKNPSKDVNDDVTLFFKTAVQTALRGKAALFPSGTGENIPRLRERFVNEEIYHSDFFQMAKAEDYSVLRPLKGRLIIEDYPAPISSDASPPLAIHLGEVAILNRDRLPKNIFEEALLAAWLESRGLKTRRSGGSSENPFQLNSETLDEREVQEILKDLDRVPHLRSFLPAFEAHPIFKGWFRRVIKLIFPDAPDMDTETVSFFFYLVQAFGDLIQTGEIIPWHLKAVEEWIARFSHRAKTMVAEANESMMEIIMLRFVCREDPELGSLMESSMNSEDARLFRIFLKGIPTQALMKRVQAMLPPFPEEVIEVLNDMLNSEDEVLVGKLHSEQNMQFLWAQAQRVKEPDRYALLLTLYLLIVAPLRIKNEEVLRGFVKIVEDYMEDLQAQDFEPHGVFEAFREIQHILAFFRGSEGQEIFQHPEKWRAWRHRLVRINPFQTEGEKNLNFVKGYSAFNGQYEELFNAFEGVPRPRFRDFLQFVGPLSENYYQSNPPPEFLRRCLKLWKEVLSKLPRGKYEALSDEIQVMFAHGADEIYLSPLLRPYASYVLGEIPALFQLSVASPLELETQADEEFQLSDYFAAFLSGGKGGEEEIGASNFNRQYALRSLQQAINDRNAIQDNFLGDFLRNRIWAVSKDSQVDQDHYLKVNAHRSSQGDLLLKLESSSGISPEHIENFFLIPGNVTRSEALFSFFRGASRIRLRTRAESHPLLELDFLPQTDPEGRVLDVRVRRKILEETENSVGTTLEVTQASKFPDVDAAFYYGQLQNYFSILPPQNLRVEFNGQGINGYKKPFAQRDGFSIYSGASAPALTKGGIFVRYLDEDYYRDLAPSLRRVAMQERIIVDIPPEIGLIGDGSDISFKDRNLPRIKKAVAESLLERRLQLALEGELPFDALPYDFYERSLSISIPEGILSDARNLATGGELKFENYLETDKLQQLLVSIPNIEIDGFEMRFSLLEILQEYRLGKLELEAIPQAIQKYIVREGAKEIVNKSMAARLFEAAGKEEQSRIALPKNIDPESDVYWAFLDWVGEISRRLNQDFGEEFFFKANFTLLPEPFLAQAGSGIVSWNLAVMEPWLSSLASALRGELGPADRFQLIKNILDTATHEYAHLAEESDETNLTHDPSFFRLQREILEKLYADTAWLEASFNALSTRYRGTYLPFREVQERWRSGS